MDDDSNRMQLEALSGKLRDLHARVVTVEQAFQPSEKGLPLLDRLTNDPEWAWLRSLSGLIADIDHVLAQKLATKSDDAVVAAHTRGMLSGEGDLKNHDFMARYVPLLQTDATLASLHGELKGLLKTFPAEPESESERLHARHQWAMRFKHKMTQS